MKKTKPKKNPTPRARKKEATNNQARKNEIEELKIQVKYLRLAVEAMQKQLDVMRDRGVLL